MRLMASNAAEAAPQPPAREGAVLTLDGVRHGYRGTPVIRDVSLTLEGGAALALLGANGAGKTTLLELCAGARQPDAGTITWSGGATVGWVPPEAAFYGRLSTRENLVAFSQLEGVAHPSRRADELLAATGLGEAADRRADRLSTGMAQRLNLGIALAGSPDALLLDEPTATLSTDQRARFWDLIGGLRRERGLSVVFSTQSVPEAGSEADRMAVLAEGTLAFTGTFSELAAIGGGEGADAAERAFIEIAVA